MDNLIVIKDGPYQDLIEQVGNLDEERYPLKTQIKYEPRSKCYNLALHDFVVLTDSKLIVELGTREGFSTDAFIRALTITNGKLYSFDPEDKLWRGNLIPTYENYLTFYQLTGEEGFEKLGHDLSNIDLLYIDTDPHDFSQTYQWLTKYWVTKLSPGGYVLLDDCAPQHTQYGCLDALKKYTEEFNYLLDYSLVFCTDFTGLGLIKFKEE